MTAPATPQVLQLLLSRGVPRPLSAQTKGSCAILSDDRCITVYDSDAADWTLTAQARWPDELQFDAHPWAAIAPAATGGVVLLNMMSCDLSGLPAEVRKSLLMQQQRYAADPLPASTLAPRYRVTLGSMQLHVSAPSGARRTVPVGGAATVRAAWNMPSTALVFSVWVRAPASAALAAACSRRCQVRR